MAQRSWLTRHWRSKLFALVLATAERAKQLMRGSKYLGEPTDNKFVVNALREIAAGKVRLQQNLDDLLLIQENIDE